MRLAYERHTPWLLAGLLLTGCPDDDDVGASGGGSGSSTGSASTGEGTTVVADSGSSAGDQGGSSEETTASPPPTEVRMSGTIEDFFAMGPIAGADITVLGQAGMETTSDASGVWELSGLAVETFDRFVVAGTDTYWGAVVPFRTELMDIEEYELSQVSLDVIDIQIGVLQAQEPTVMVEDDTAVFLVALEQNLATGAVVQVEPPPPPNTFYAPDANGQPVLNTTEISWSIYPVAVFFNLPPGPEGTYEITVTHPERECTVEDPQPPTFGRHINLIRVDCPAPA
ncbi:MAG: hypothetical protein AB1Z98_12070 [Nannocystaceae bacterium]